MNQSTNLFEVSWEVANKVGGIHTVLSTKARSMVAALGDAYVLIGPWLLTQEDHHIPFDEEPGFELFSEACREMGIPVKVGRWRIPSHPRTILIEFSKLYGEKDAILAELWEDFGVNSISGEWDYVEPVLFGYAAGRVVERWLEEFVVPLSRRTVIHSHEWMTGSSILYAKKHLPSVGTVFTTHATMLGRALSSLGHSPEDGLGGKTPEELAEEHGVVAKHSLEGICAREADAFTTVSEITAREAELLHRRAPNPLTPNGIDLSVIDELAGPSTRGEVRASLTRVATTFLGEDVTDAAFVCISGRYEFHNKGIDLTLDALARLEGQKGRRLVLFVLVPAGNSGLRAELRERLDGGVESDGPIGISTHNLHDEEHDPVHERCLSLGFDNAPNSRVKVVQVPIYLDKDDGFLNQPYEAVLRAMDLSAFPSYYEPWGYTPQESLAVGVPTITSDYAGFGRWAEGEGLGRADGVTILKRVKVRYGDAVDAMLSELDRFLTSGVDAQTLRTRCRAAADRASWRDLGANYHSAHAIAIEAVQTRLEQGVPQLRRPRKVVSAERSGDAKQPHLVSFDVSATLPGALSGLDRLARNPWWCWDPEGADLFEEISPRAWKACEHDPVRFLQRVYPEDIRAKAKDADFVTKVERVIARFDRELLEPSLQGAWCQNKDVENSISAEHPVAYFSAEFGIHESLRIYSGGLGVLAGDHLKAASDMNLPLVGVGIMYSHGYMGQRLSPSGEQIAEDHPNDPARLGLELVKNADGSDLEVVVPLPGRDLRLCAWRYQVGRISLYLLDANIEGNREEDRKITRNLYGGDGETRLQQEIVLGRGGVRLLRKLGLQPSVWHMNEGHAAFLTIERVGQLALKEGLTFDAASELVQATTLFTTHTPVPAGHDRFGEDLMRRYFSDAAEWVGVPWERFLALGQAPDEEATEFNMTHLAMHFSSWVNGVSQLHADVSRELLRSYWPGLLKEEIPVQGITNGIHLGTWTAPQIMEVLGVVDRKVTGADFKTPLKVSKRKALWKVRQELKARLLEEARSSVTERLVERSESPRVLEAINGGLSDERALVIGFARRFAPYKRAHLLFQDIERLTRILGSADRPVRILIAGKAHPRDGLGKDILQEVFQHSRTPSLMGKVVFLEDYDIALARHLVRGVDVWLNNPTRKLEASGTSGMKVCANGGLNLSVADGWWPEAFDGKNGWRIGDGRVYGDQELQDQLDAAALYALLEDELVPLYFERDKDGVPAGWMERVEHCLATVPPVFDTARMVGEYAERAYLPLGRAFTSLSTAGRSEIYRRAEEKHRLREGFESLHVRSAHVSDISRLEVGEQLEASLEVELGSLAPEDVVVELVVGPADEVGELHDVSLSELSLTGTSDSGAKLFSGSHTLERSGGYAYGLRVRPRLTKDASPALRQLVVWA